MKYTFLLLAVLSILTGCKNHPGEPKAAFNEEHLLHRLQVLSHDSLQGRYFGSRGNKVARDYIAGQFDSLGIMPAFSTGYIQSFPVTFSGKHRQFAFPVSGPEADPGNVADTTVTGGNVVAMIPGKLERTIVITGHFDHVGLKNGQVFNGASDNATGAASLLTIANYFKHQNPKHTLIFAAVDGEEIGLLGSEHLVQNFPVEIAKIALNINLDMLAHDQNSKLYITGLHHYPELKPALERLHSPEIPFYYGHDNPDDPLQQDWTLLSDHAAFHHAGIPFIYFGIEDHPDYHKASDEFQNIDPGYYIETVKLVIRAIEHCDAFLTENAQINL